MITRDKVGNNERQWHKVGVWICKIYVDSNNYVCKLSLQHLIKIGPDYCLL